MKTNGKPRRRQVKQFGNFPFTNLPETGTRVHTCTTDYSGEEDKMCMYRPLAKGSLSPRFIPPFYDILYTVHYYVTVPWDPKLCLPTQLTSIYYIIEVGLSVTRYDGKSICGSYFVISKLDVEEIKATLLWNKKPFFKVRFIWNFQRLLYQCHDVAVEWVALQESRARIPAWRLKFFQAYGNENK